MLVLVVAQNHGVNLGGPEQIPPLNPAGQVASIAFRVLVYAWVASIIPVTAGWAPVADAIYDRAREGRPWLRLLPSIPFLTLLVTGASAVAVGSLSAGGLWVTVLFWVLPLGGWLGATVWLAVEVPRLDLPVVAMRRGSGVGFVLAVLFGVMTTAVGVWGVAMALQPSVVIHHEFVVGSYQSGYHVITAPAASWWVPITLAFAGTTVTSALGARTAVRAWRVARTL
ncbi:MAG: hypothetical protein M3R71_04760 [Actinomycetota bacterium]|nr:hypothetical protein [Actinomycetota bacterium]